MRGLARCCIGIVAASSITACSLLISADDLSQNPGQTTDAGSDQVAPLDADSADTLPPNCDAGAFCTNFEDTQSAGLTRVDYCNTGGRGTAEIDNGASLSPPSSFLTILPPGNTNVCSWKQRLFTNTPAVYRLQADIRIETPTEVSIHVMEIFFAPDTQDEQGIVVQFKGDRAGLEESTNEAQDTSYGFQTPLPPARADKWRHVEVLLTIGQPTRATLLVDGTPMVNDAELQSAKWKRLAPRLLIGITGPYDVPSELRVRYDNVAFEME